MYITAITLKQIKYSRISNRRWNNWEWIGIASNSFVSLAGSLGHMTGSQNAVILNTHGLQRNGMVLSIWRTCCITIVRRQG